MEDEMRRAIASVVLLGLVATASSVGWAQSLEPDACERICREQEATCITACGERDDPIECEAACRDAAAACQRRCEEGA
jgi:hypothetical protein